MSTADRFSTVNTPAELLSYLSRTSRRSSNPTPSLRGGSPVDATPDELQRAMSGDAFVLFYSPTCGHCQRFEGEFEKIWSEWPSLEGGAALLRVNRSTTEVPERIRDMVKYVPTMLLFKSGDVAEYKGDREASKILGFCKSHGIV